MVTLQATANRGLWRNHDFLKLWSGETVAQVGAQITQIALPLLVLGVLHATPSQVGLVSAMQLLPALCVTPFAGILIDTYDRRLILLGANLGRAVALALVPVLYFADAMSIPALCAIAFVVGACTATFEVAYMSYLPAVVATEHLVSANSKLQGSYAVAQIGGPGLGGLLTKFLGAWFAILANVVAYLAAFFAIFLIRHRDPGGPPAAGNRPKLADLVASFSLIWRHRVLRVLTFQAGWFNFCEQAILTLFVVYAVKELGMDAGGVGMVLALGALGSLVGAVAAKQSEERLGFSTTLIAAMGVASCAPLLLPLTGGALWTSWLLSTFAFGVYGFGLTIYNVHVVAFRQTVIPIAVIGRATAAYRVLTYGPFPLGALAGGVLGEGIGLWNSILTMALASVGGWLLFAVVGGKYMSARPESTTGGVARSRPSTGPHTGEQVNTTEEEGST